MKTHKRVLVTGGAGFIGANLCRRLLDGGDEVVCLDNLYTGKLENIEPFSGNGKFGFINHDVMEPFPKDIGAVDMVYNLACPASPPHYQKDKEKTLLTNVLGAKNVLDFALFSKNCPVFQASTSEVYGDPQVHPQTEDYVGHVNPIGPRSCYDEGKRAAESLFFAFREKHGSIIRIGRIFNTYGPGMDPHDGRVVSNFIVQCLRGEPFTVYGDGGQTRSFCYIDDLLNGMTQLMDKASPDFTGPVNIGNSAEFTIMQLAELVMKIVGKRVAMQYLPRLEDDPVVRRPSLSLIREITGWEPSVPLHIGLDHTIQYFMEILNRP